MPFSSFFLKNGLNFETKLLYLRSKTKKLIANETVRARLLYHWIKLEVTIIIH